jgi:hypothetical protein
MMISKIKKKTNSLVNTSLCKPAAHQALLRGRLLLLPTISGDSYAAYDRYHHSTISVQKISGGIGHALVLDQLLQIHDWPLAF